MPIFAAHPPYIWITLLVYFIIAFALSVLANALFLRLLRHIGTTRPAGKETIRWAAQSKPTIGGFGFFIVFTVACLFGALWIMRKNEPITTEILGCYIATLVGFMVGLIDDLQHTSPYFKLVGQVVCALILLLTNVVIPLSSVFWLNAVVTIVWVVGIMNAINMLDNMDGITASVSVMIILAVMQVLIQQGLFTSFYSVVSLGVLGGILGFLYFNWHPSRLYMGDSGSQFLGVFLSFISIKYLWSFRPAPDSLFALQQFLLPAVAFLLPIIDTTTVVFRRMARGQSPFQGGRDHTTHHLAYCGLNDRQVAQTFVVLSAISVLIAIWVTMELLANKWNNFKTALILAYILLVFVLMQYFYERGKQNKH